MHVHIPEELCDTLKRMHALPCDTYSLEPYGGTGEVTFDELLFFVADRYGITTQNLKDALKL